MRQNVGASSAHVTAGSAKVFDHACLVHGLWTTMARLHCGSWIERVPTKDNIADLPSRSVGLHMSHEQTSAGM